MILQTQHLNPEILSDECERAYIRDGFGLGLVEAGENDPNVVALCADLAESTRVLWFKEKFPERYIELGVAEQNLATVAAGLANYGKVPFITSYASFSPGRNNEQIRTTISLNDVPVKVVGCHAGVSVGPDGATHQALEDVALMRVQPNMSVIVPCDKEEARKATLAIADVPKPFYLRLGREKTPVITTERTDFEIGKAYKVWESENPQVAIIACGSLLAEAINAASQLDEEHISTVVVNMHTIKPLDTNMLDELISSVSGIVTVEEHQVAGGLGSAVAEYTAEHSPMPMRLIGVRDQYGQSGTPTELIAHYGLDAETIIEKVKELI